MTSVVLLEGVEYLGLLVFLGLTGLSAVATAGPLFGGGLNWWYKVKKPAHNPPDWLKGILMLIAFACLAVGGYIIWQKPISIVATGEVKDLTDLMTHTHKGLYLTLLSLHFVAHVFPPLQSAAALMHGCPGIGIWVQVVEALVVIAITVIAFIFDWLAGIFYAIYLVYLLYFLSVWALIYHYIRVSRSSDAKGL